jgi:hypothetical protein
MELEMETITNFDIVYDTNNTGFLKESLISFYFKGINPEEVLMITNDFARNSISVKVEKVISNSVELRIKSFELSNFKTPAFYLRGKQNGLVKEFFVPEIEIKTSPRILSITNKKPVEEIFGFFDPLPYVLILIVILTGVAGFLLFKFFRNKKDKTLKEVEIDPLSEFIENLEKIEKIQLNEKNYKEIFSEISEALRRFLERKLNFNALEMTSSEIILYLKYESREVSEDVIKNIDEILKITDRVKFAKYFPSSYEKDVCLKKAMEIAKSYKNQSPIGTEKEEV